jgi:hypothetical protein
MNCSIWSIRVMVIRQSARVKTTADKICATLDQENSSPKIHRGRE